MNPSRVDREDERRMLICRPYLDGNCPRGNHCHFRHSMLASTPTITGINISSFQPENQLGHGGYDYFSLSRTPRPLMGPYGITGQNGVTLGGESSSFKTMINEHLLHSFNGFIARPPVTSVYSRYGEMACPQHRVVGIPVLQNAGEMPTSGGSLLNQQQKLLREENPLSAKEEFRMKMKNIAEELKKESTPDGKYDH